jgi:hypothetical protein
MKKNGTRMTRLSAAGRDFYGLPRIKKSLKIRKNQFYPCSNKIFATLLNNEKFDP